MDIVELEFFPTDFSTNALVYHLGEKKLYKNIGTEDVPVFSEITSGVPVGTVEMFAGLNAQIPAGFLRCNGGAVSRATYADLYAAVGTQWGIGDGNSTFNLPNFETGNKFPRASNSDDELGEDGGLSTVTLTVAQMPAHNHSYSFPDSRQNPAYNFGVNQRPIPEPTDDTTGSTGGNQSHENKPPYASVYFIIKF